MSNVADLFRKPWQGFVSSIREFPLEALLGVTYFVIEQRQRYFGQE